MPLCWDAGLEVGIPELDVQLKELYSRFEKFSGEVALEGDGAELAAFIDFLDKYTREHLKYEEHLLIRANYPGREEHIQAHRQFMDEMESFKQRMSRGEDAKELHHALQGMMIRWLIMHNKHQDRDFLDFLKSTIEKAEHRFARKKLGEILVDSHYITVSTLDKALRMQERNGKRLGETLVEMGVITFDELDAALLAQEGKCCLMNKLGRILVESGIITYATLDHALGIQKITGKKLGEVMVGMGVVTWEDIIEAQAIQKGMLALEE